MDALWMLCGTPPSPAPPPTSYHALRGFNIYVYIYIYIIYVYIYIYIFEIVFLVEMAANGVLILVRDGEI